MRFDIYTVVDWYLEKEAKLQRCLASNVTFSGDLSGFEQPERSIKISRTYTTQTRFWILKQDIGMLLPINDG